MLDPQGSQNLFEIVQKLVHTGTTVIIAGHQLEWISRYADRVIALAQGEVILDDTPAKVMASPLLTQSGIGWLRYTLAAHQAIARGLWPASRPLPVTVEQAGEGFRQTNQRIERQEQTGADPD